MSLRNVWLFTENQLHGQVDLPPSQHWALTFDDHMLPIPTDVLGLVFTELAVRFVVHHGVENAQLRVSRVARLSITICMVINDIERRLVRSETKPIVTLEPEGSPIRDAGGETGTSCNDSN